MFHVTIILIFVLIYKESTRDNMFNDKY